MAQGFGGLLLLLGGNCGCGKSSGCRVLVLGSDSSFLSANHENQKIKLKKTKKTNKQTNVL